MLEYKNIHIGKHIKYIANRQKLSIPRACAFFKCNPRDILKVYSQKTIDTELLLRWCKLLDYNFFMFYHTHLQIYKPNASRAKLTEVVKGKEELYVFRRNLYSVEIIDWLMSELEKGHLSKNDILKKYNIPKTTLFRWIKKHNIVPLSNEVKNKL